MITIRDINFKIVKRSKNLRGILEYTRNNAVEHVDIWPNAKGAQYGVTWKNGSSVMSDFADATVCQQFFRHRIARFPNIIIHGSYVVSTAELDLSLNQH